MFQRFPSPRKGCQLLKIDLSGWDEDELPNVNGNLDKHFCDLEDLETLNLNETRVSGDIGVLRRNMKLKALNLDYTKVTGNIEALANVTHLESLWLSNTAVTGDLAALKSAKLKTIGVDNTKVTCSQDAPLRAVLLKLGFDGELLKDLNKVK